MSAWARAMETLRPMPFRGDLIAAGAVAVAVGIVLLDARMQDDWQAGMRFAVVGAAALLMLTLAWRAPREGDEPRMYVSTLLAAGYPLTLLALVELGDALGGSADSEGTLTWVLLALAALYATAAVLRNSAICTLLGSATLAVAAMAAWWWIFDPGGVTPLQWLSLVTIAAAGLGALALRDARRAHAVALVDVAGLAALLLAFLVGSEPLFGGLFGADGAGPGSPWGWKLVLAAVGFGLVAYGAVDRERGPAWLGAAVLGTFVALAGSEGSLLWWPLVLLGLGGAAVAAGLRPTTPLPPSPDADAPEAPMRPLGGGGV